MIVEIYKLHEKCISVSASILNYTPWWTRMLVAIQRRVCLELCGSIFTVIGAKANSKTKLPNFLKVVDFVI